MYGLLLLATSVSSASRDAATLDVRATDVRATDVRAVRWNAECTPNYRDRLLASQADGSRKPTLVSVRRGRTIQVSISDGGDSTRFRLAKEAIRAWEGATRGIPGGALDFRVSRGTDERPAPGVEIVVSFKPAAKIHDYLGYTSELEGPAGAWAKVEVATVDSANKPVSDARMRRIVMHELGHALGIWGHSPDGRDIMSLDESTGAISVSDVNTMRLAFASKRDDRRDRSFPGGPPPFPPPMRGQRGW